MSINKLEVANPVAESVIPTIHPATRPDDLADKRIGLYWNFKPGGDIALDQVAARLGERYPTAQLLRIDGEVGASVRHITPKQGDQIASECDVVVGTTGD